MTTPGQDLRCQSELMHRDIKVRLHDGILSIGNRHLRRLQALNEKGVCTTLLEDGEHRPRAGSDGNCDYYYFGLGRSPEVRALTAGVVPETLFDGEHVSVHVHLEQENQGVEIVREYLIYPDLAALSVRHTLRSAVIPRLGWTARCDLNQYLVKPHESRVDRLIPQGNGGLVRCVVFNGRTDHSDAPVMECRPDASRELRGNLLFYEESDGSGLAILQEAPPSAERRDLEPYDFRLDDWGVVCSCNWGIHPGELREGHVYQGYRSTLLVYGSASERDRVLKAYQRRRYPRRFAQAGAVTVNPWGGGGFVKKVSQEFLLAEIAASAEVGGTAYQVDDGWQQGDTYQALTQNVLVDREFWRVSDKLGGTLEPLRRQAKASGVELALWFLPSPNRGFRDWQDGLDIILDMHRNVGIRKFKIDGLMIRTCSEQEKFELMLRTARELSNGEIFFNLDVTSSQRGGYLQYLEYGNLFLENRYCFGGLGYHPEKVLRHLWMLSRYTRPQNIQAEVANPADVKPDFYQKRGLVDPRSYPIEYWAAVAFCSSPLLWMNPSAVPAELRSRLRRVMDLHRKYAEAMFEGEIYPCGGRPDGRACTGFQMVPGRPQDPQLLLVFAELGAAETSTVLHLPQPLRVNTSWLLEYGEATLAEQPAGGWKVTLPGPASFALFRG